MEGARQPLGRDDCLDDEVFIRYLAGDLGREEEAGVRQHIGSCDECRVVLAEAAREQADSEVIASETRPTDGSRSTKRGDALEPGDTIEGRYRIERRIGRGGMGIVFRAEDIRRGIPVAVKIMNRERADEPDSVARFLRETRVVACIESEHVIKIYDVGKLESGTPYMATELLVGSDLGAHLHEQDGAPLDIRTAVGFIVQAARGLAAAHAAKIIHRDVKLTNLFLAKEPVHGDHVVKVLDFGLCKARSPRQDGGESMQLTEVDTMMGTPHYMSPEQYVSARDVGPATDVWALGVCLYRLLTGEVPFDGPNVTNICAKVVRGEFVRPRKLREEIPEAIEDVIVKCLTRDPEHRYRDARELGDALTLAIDETLRAQIRTVEIPAVEEKKLATTAALPRASSPGAEPTDNTTVPIPAPIPRGVHVTTARTERPATPAVSPYLIAAAIITLAVLGVVAFVIGNARRPPATEPAIVASPLVSTAPLVAAPLVTEGTPPVPEVAPPATVVVPAPEATPAPSARARPKTRPSAHPHGSSSAGKEQLYDKY